jgi:hypothetical protein
MQFLSTCGMTTLSQSDPPVTHEHVASLPDLPRDDAGPVFAEPWQAQAFAPAVKLSEHGHFTWKEWAAALADRATIFSDTIRRHTVPAGRARRPNSFSS